MRHADITPRHEQILHIAGVETTIRHRIGIDQDVGRHGLELLIREISAVLRIGAVQVDAPRRSERGILVRHMFRQIVLFQDVIAQQPARFAFTRHIGNPPQLPIPIEVVPFQPILQVAPVRIDDQHPVIANPLEILDLIEIHSCLPCPLAHRDPFAAFVGKFDPVIEFGKCARAIGFDRIPLHRSPHRHFVGLFGCNALAELLTAFTPHTVIGPSQIADCPVPRAIGKERSLEPQLTAVFDMFGRDGNDPVALLLHSDHPIVQEKRHPLLPGQPIQLLLIFIGRCGLCITPLLGPELLLQASQLLVGAHFDPPAQMDTDFGAVVPAHYRTVVDQGNITPQTGRRNRRTHAGNSRSHDNQIVRSRRRHLIGQMQGLAPESIQLRKIGGRYIPFFRRKIDRIATAVETGQVMQPDHCVLLLHRHLACLLPHPCLTRTTQHLRNCLLAHRERKSSGTLALSPRSGPVIRTDVDVILSPLREGHPRSSVLHRNTHSMRQQIGRPHQVHKLLIDYPSALVAEALRLYEQVGCLRSLHKQHGRQ